MASFTNKLPKNKKYMKVQSGTFLSVFLLFSLLSFGCNAADKKEFEVIPLTTLEAAFNQFKEPAITHRRFKHADIQPLIEKHKGAFEISELGKSIEGKSISNLKWGGGKTKVMLWSQMHGNESTTTKAIFDFLNLMHSNSEIAIQFNKNFTFCRI